MKTRYLVLFYAAVALVLASCTNGAELLPKVESVLTSIHPEIWPKDKDLLKIEYVGQYKDLTFFRTFTSYQPGKSTANCLVVFQDTYTYKGHYFGVPDGGISCFDGTVTFSEDSNNPISFKKGIPVSIYLSSMTEKVVTFEK